MCKTHYYVSVSRQPKHMTWSSVKSCFYFLDNCSAAIGCLCPGPYRMGRFERVSASATSAPPHRIASAGETENRRKRGGISDYESPPFPPNNSGEWPCSYLRAPQRQSCKVHSVILPCCQHLLFPLAVRAVKHCLSKLSAPPSVIFNSKDSAWSVSLVLGETFLQKQS